MVAWDGNQEGGSIITGQGETLGADGYVIILMGRILLQVSACQNSMLYNKLYVFKMYNSVSFGMHAMINNQAQSFEYLNLLSIL